MQISAVTRPIRRTVSFPLVAGLSLASISLLFSATGLVHLFAGAGVSIVAMALAFEVAKVALTTHLIRQKGTPMLSIFGSVALLCLAGISSIGV